jgi:hypothetical protein
MSPTRGTIVDSTHGWRRESTGGSVLATRCRNSVVPMITTTLRADDGCVIIW